MDKLYFYGHNKVYFFSDKKKIDPTALEVKWQIWLTTPNASINSLEKIKHYSWQKEKKANLTGTSLSYHPRTNNTIKVKEENNNETWKPDK